MKMKLYKPAKAGHLVLVDTVGTVDDKSMTLALVIPNDVPNKPWDLPDLSNFDTSAVKGKPSRKNEFIKEHLNTAPLAPLSEPYTTQQKANAIFSFLKSTEGTLWLSRWRLLPKTLRIQEVKFVPTKATYRSGTIKLGDSWIKT